MKHDLPVKPKKKLAMATLLDNPNALNESGQMTQEEPKEQQLEQTVDLTEMTDDAIGVKDKESQVNQELADLREEVKLLKKQLLDLNDKLDNKPKFDIDELKTMTRIFLSSLVLLTTIRCYFAMICLKIKQRI